VGEKRITNIIGENKMYQCGFCNTKYDLSDENMNKICKVTDKNHPDVIRTVVACPGCNKKRIVGGELDFDPYNGEDCIMMFGFDYVEAAHSELPIFEGVMIK
jgi:hypothetical protein